VCVQRIYVYMCVCTYVCRYVNIYVRIYVLLICVYMYACSLLKYSISQCLNVRV